jgi:hypothetical protein
MEICWLCGPQGLKIHKLSTLCLALCRALGSFEYICYCWNFFLLSFTNFENENDDGLHVDQIFFLHPTVLWLNDSHYVMMRFCCTCTSDWNSVSHFCLLLFLHDNQPQENSQLWFLIRSLSKRRLMRPRLQWSSSWKRCSAWVLLLATWAWTRNKSSRTCRWAWISLFLCWRRIGKMYVVHPAPKPVHDSYFRSLAINYVMHDYWLICIFLQVRCLYLKSTMGKRERLF